jgi:hydrogenase expression/formation protein HypC
MGTVYRMEGSPMCLAIPMVLVERNEFEGVAEIDGVQRKISVMYVPEAEVGDYVLVHAGFAIGQVDADEAAKTLELLRDYSDAMAEL